MSTLDRNAILPRRIMAALILLYGALSGLRLAVEVIAGSPTPPAGAVALAAGLGICKIVIGGALWSGRIPAWPTALTLAGLSVLQVRAPDEAAIALDVMALALTGVIAVLLFRQARSNPAPI